MSAVPLSLEKMRKYGVERVRMWWNLFNVISLVVNMLKVVGF